MPEEVLIAPVTSDDPEEKKAGKNKKLPADVEVEELSKEDQELKERLDLFVERIQDTNEEIGRQALNSLKDEIRSATSSMTSVPKPLRFMQDHYETIKTYFDGISASTWRREVADLMSILAMVFEEPKTRSCLKLRLQSTPDVESWGAQYIKHLAAEIRIEMQERDELTAEQDEAGLMQLIELDQLFGIAHVVVEFYMKHNSEPEACDTLLEVDQLDRIVDMCEEHNFPRVVAYLQSTASYHVFPDDEAIFRICFRLCQRFDDWYGAMRYALRLDAKELVTEIMVALKEKKTEKRQVAFLLGWHQYGYEEASDDEEDDEMDEDDDDDEMGVNDIISNVGLHDAFHDLARELDVLEPKDPEVDIFKEHLSDDASQIVSARKQLAATYVNSFVNSGFGRDKYMCSGEENATDVASQWIYRNKDHGMMAAVASVGMIMLWDEDAVNAVDRYVEAGDPNIRAGAFLAIGVACSGMRSDADLAYALLQSHAQRENNETDQERVASSFGLGLAYAGQAKSNIHEVLYDCIGQDDGNTLECSCISALSLGLVYVGTCDAEISNLLLVDLLERNAEDLDNPLLLLHVLGLGLLFLQRSEEVETTLAAVDAFEHINPKFARTVKTTLEVCAYAGTGNVLKIQQFLEIVGEHFDDEKKENTEEEKKDDAANAQALRNNPLLGGGGGRAGAAAGGANNNADENNEEEKDVDDHRYFQSIATIGVAAVALGEELGVEMALRMFNHFIQYGNTRVKRAVPLALALLSISNPSITVADILSRLSHDHDDTIAQNAIFGLGLIGAGTNNARIATMLRQLMDYYAKEANHLFLVRVAQGLLFMGKGLLTAQPLHSDRFLLSKVAFGGILAMLFASIDLKNTILGSRHYLLFSLVLAMKPRMLVTLDENLKQQKVTVRVGQALDVVGIAGKPKTITGFQTHESPVLLGYKDRAELATQEYLAVPSILEGFAIVKNNPDYDEKKKDRD